MMNQLHLRSSRKRCLLESGLIIAFQIIRRYVREPEAVPREWTPARASCRRIRERNPDFSPRHFEVKDHGKGPSTLFKLSGPPASHRCWIRSFVSPSPGCQASRRSGRAAGIERVPSRLRHAIRLRENTALAASGSRLGVHPRRRPLNASTARRSGARARNRARFDDFTRDRKRYGYVNRALSGRRTGRLRDALARRMPALIVGPSRGEETINERLVSIRRPLLDASHRLRRR